MAPESPRSFTVDERETGERLDRFLARRAPDISRSRLKALIEAGEAAVGGRTIGEPAHRVKRGDLVTLAIPEAAPATPQPEPIPLSIVYEDDAVVVIDKPPGLVVHPGAGNPSGTLVNALIAHCGTSLSGIGGVRRPGIVHRLDKDTSGLLLIAKTDAAHRSLSAQFADHGRSGVLERRYLALVWDAPERRHGTVGTLIDRSPRNRLKMAVSGQSGREAITHYEVLKTYGRTGEPPVAGLIECRLETGRTHQIRLHLAHLGHPVMGDDVYGAGFRTKARRLDAGAAEALDRLARQALHAAVLRFAHPSTGEVLRFESALPSDMARLERALAAM